MSEFFKAELKDRFLEYALERDDYFEVRLLYDEFLRPNYSLEFVQKLIREIMDYDHDLLDIMSGNGAKIFMLSTTYKTEAFLDEGGFKDLFIQEEEKWDNFLEQLANTRKLSSDEKASLGRTEKKEYKRERYLLFGLITAVTISFVFTLYSLVSGIFAKVDQERLSDIEDKLNALEIENKALKEELDSLQYYYSDKSG